MKPLLGGPSPALWEMENSCDGVDGMGPLTKENSGGAPGVDAWVTWVNSWGGQELGPMVNPLTGDEAAAAAAAVAAAAGVGGPAEGTMNPFAVDDDPPVVIPPEN